MLLTQETPAQILEALLQNPGMVYVPHGMQAAYILLPGSDKIMYCFVGNFRGMTDEEVNQFVQTAIKEAE